MICAAFLTLGGCQWTEPSVVYVPDGAANFCDVEELRRFSQAELDWRADNAPWNLRRDFKTNTTWGRECAAVGAM
jgi:hypothetical protein